MKYLSKIYISFVVIIFISIGYLYYTVSQTQTHLHTNLQELFVLQAQHFTENIKAEITKKVPKNLHLELKKNQDLREELQNALAILITPSFKYVYVLYRDNNGKFRYLLDGSREEKGDFDQKLNVDKQNWNLVYETKQVNVIMQEDIQKLWGTYLQPIIYKGEVEGVIAIDFSANLPKSISTIMKPAKDTFIYIFISIILLLLILLYQSLVTFRTKQESITDELTQTYNRNFLRDFLKNIDASKYQLMMLDIDYFKKVNDTHGHKAGDFILSEVAITIKNIVRENDVIIRFGGEEFLIFIKKSINNSQHTKNVAHRFRESLEKKTFTYEEVDIRVTASIGVTTNPHEFVNITEAIKKADEMLYIAKKTGRNQVIFDKK